MNIKFYFVRDILNFYFIHNYSNQSSYKFVIHLMLLYLMYVVASIELKYISEVCPLSVNIFIYLFLVILLFIISIIATYVQDVVLNSIYILKDFKVNILYSQFIWNHTLIHFILYRVLPHKFYLEFSWINFRILYWILIPNSILAIVWDAIIKYRGYLVMTIYYTI